MPRTGVVSQLPGIGPLAIKPVISSLYLLFFFLFEVQATVASPQEKGNILYQLDFTKAGEDGHHWLSKQGFTLKKDMSKGKSIQLRGNNSQKGLQLTTNRPAFGLAIKEDLKLDNIDKIVVEWGIEKYPEGASWQSNSNREALMIHLFFGPKVKADHFYLPDSPYFIGIFLCHDDPIFMPYTGKSYKNTGRYVCLDNPQRGDIIVSSFPIAQAYRQWFAADTVPPLTGIGIEVDTSDLAEGESEAYLKQITLYSDRR